MSLLLNSSADSSGWLVASYETADGESVRVDVMPPKDTWNGGSYYAGFEPHETEWVIYIDGDEVDRVLSWQEIEESVRQTLSKSA